MFKPSVRLRRYAMAAERRKVAISALWQPCGSPVAALWQPCGSPVAALWQPCGSHGAALWQPVRVGWAATSKEIQTEAKLRLSCSSPFSRRIGALKSFGGEGILAGRLIIPAVRASLYNLLKCCSPGTSVLNSPRVETMKLYNLLKCCSPGTSDLNSPRVETMKL